MDPISAVFASYIDLVSFRAMQRINDMLGTEVQAVVVEHNGVNVPYSYQLWKIHPKSVCAPHRQNVARYSKCTISAQSLFQETCAHLQANPREHWKYRKLKNLYCAAAVSYQPTVANVEWSKDQTPQRQARAECNLAVATFMTEQSSENRKKKEKVCREYHALKNK